ncbi:lanthionine synthetase LanC family protein [Streptomyces sp. NPDC057496]|uniref:lanthionine synthetase C family protein n=1 Tax=Streptomyces sp. NPDC057496 TaxID=3346149 RepID=UPI0036A54EF0
MTAPHGTGRPGPDREPLRTPAPAAPPTATAPSVTAPSITAPPAAGASVAEPPAAGTSAAVPPATGPRERAGQVSELILDKLADPATTMAATRIPAEASDDGEDEGIWAEMTLGSGSPGLAIAFSGAARPGTDRTARAHGYLAVATRAAGTGDTAPSGIFKGPGALAFAVLLAHRATGGYVSALRRLDGYQRELVRTALPAVPQDSPLPTIGHYELVRGMTGVGRYLLARVGTCGEELETVLAYLVRLAQGEVEHRGHKVPRWWALDAPRIGAEHRLPDGHLNLGLSHGVAGPLALLSTAWSQGVRVPGQREAIESAAGLLTRWAVRDGHGVFWPPHLSLTEWLAGPDAFAEPAGWPSWCYGAPGVSRGLQLAGLALDRTDWTGTAKASAERLLALPMERWGINDHALCHGWAGALHQLGRLNEHMGDERIAALRDRIAARLVADFDPELPFGHRFTMTKVPFGTDVSGYLDGAAGVALALDSYSVGGTPSDWDMPLLLS